MKPYGRNKDHHFVFDWLVDTNSTGFGDERAMNELVHRSFISSVEIEAWYVQTRRSEWIQDQIFTVAIFIVRYQRDKPGV